MHQSSDTAARAAAPSTSAQLPADACSHTAAVQAFRQLLNYLWVAVGALREMQHVRFGLVTEVDDQLGLHKRPQLRHGHAVAHADPAEAVAGAGLHLDTQW